MIIINRRFEVDLEKSLVKDSVTNHVSTLGVNETELLSYFLSHPNELLSKKQLIDNIWTKRGVVVEESSLMNALSYCRKAFSDKNGEVIKTERGKGYRFVGAVDTESIDIKDGDDSAQTSLNTGHALSQANDSSNQPSHVRAGFDFQSVFNKKWLFVYLVGSIVSLVLGYYIHNFQTERLVAEKAGDYSLVRYDSCIYKGKERTIDLGPSTVVTRKSVSIAINNELTSVSFPSYLTESFCE